MENGRLAELVIDASPEWIAHFWSRVDRSPGLGPNGDCHEWRGGATPRGYGVHCTKRLGLRSQRYAHRIAYALEHGSVPAGKQICHTCDNPPCCNTAHLFPGTQLENMRDASAKGRIRNQRRLTDEQVRALRALYAAGGITFALLGSQFGICMQHAHAIVRGTRHERTPA